MHEAHFPMVALDTNISDYGDAEGNKSPWATMGALQVVTYPKKDGDLKISCPTVGEEWSAGSMTVSLLTCRDQCPISIHYGYECSRIRLQTLNSGVVQSFIRAKRRRLVLPNSLFPTSARFAV